MANPKAEMRLESEKLDTIIDLLRQSLAVELLYHKVARGSIAKTLHIAKSTVISMLKDVEKGEE